MKARLGYTLATSLALLAGLAGCSPAAQEAGTAPAAEVVRAHAQTEATQSGKSEDEVRTQFVGRQPMGRLGTAD